MTWDYSDALRLAAEAAMAAGALLREEFLRPGGPRGYGGHCDADARAEQAIRERLISAYPDWGYLGEETGQRSAAPDAQHLWLVDPNSGTSAFLEGHRGTSVSIALLREGIPVLGVIYAFSTPDEEGDLFSWAEGCGPIRRRGRETAPPSWPDRLTPRDVVLLSQRADEDPEANARCVAPARFRSVPGVAHRLALVASGEAAAMVSLDSPCCWDYAAGHALLRAAGGLLLDQEGNEVRYTREGRSEIRSCFGGAPGVVSGLWNRPWRKVLAHPPESDPTTELPFPVRLSPGRAVGDAGLLSRAQGCLLGQLAGDSLGSLVEFERADRLQRQYPGGLRLLQDGGTWGILAGQPTDDSELALALARSLVACGGYDPEAAARAYSYWYRSRPFDIGGTTRAALRAAAKSIGSVAVAAKKAADESSQSNGSLMRISPLATWGHRLSPHQLADLASEDSSLTHPHPVCRESCAVFAVAVARAVGGGGSPQEVYRHTLGWAESACWDASVLSALRSAAEYPPADYQTRQGWVLVALQNAFYQLLHAPTLEEGVVATVMAGGDTDTNAAIAGALLGAVHGRGAVPEQWRRMILSCRPIQHLTPTRHPRPRPFWPVDALEVAETLAALSTCSTAVTYR